METALAPFRRYFDFQGRSRRSEFWLFALLLGVIECVLLFVGVVGANHANPNDPSPVTMLCTVLLLILGLGSIIPSLALTVRRLHDSDKSGWMLLIGLIPFGGIVLLIFYCLDGTPGPNRYGPDPKGRGGAQSAAVFS